MLKGKRLSILGDSISTYRGISDDAFRNATIGNNPCYYTDPFPVEQTYWHRVMTDLNLTLCVNNSWSGGNLTGRGDPKAGVERAKYLSDNRGEKPDIVIVFMGINDLGRGVLPAVFEEDYKLTLQTVKENVPDAIVCCVNLPDRDVLMKKRRSFSIKPLIGRCRRRATAALLRISFTAI